MLNIGDEMMIARSGNEGCARARNPMPGQLTKLSRLRDAPSRRVAEPDCQRTTLYPTVRVRMKTVTIRGEIGL
jgi:hypothetical protein